MHFVLNNFSFFFENSAIYEIMWRNIAELCRPHANIAHEQCMLDN